MAMCEDNTQSRNLSDGFKSNLVHLRFGLFWAASLIGKTLALHVGVQSSIL